MPYDPGRFPISSAVSIYYDTKRDKENQAAIESERALRMKSLARQEEQAQKEYDFNNSLKNIGTEGQGLASQMKARAQQARIYGLTDKADIYDAMSRKAQEEGVIGMSQALISDDINGALTHYNSNGEDVIESIRPFETVMPDGSKRVLDGERQYTVRYANGQETTIDPHKLLARYGKDPKDPNADYAKAQFDYALDINKEAVKEKIKREGKATGGLSHSGGGGGKGLTPAQQANDDRIEAARRRLNGVMTNDPRLQKVDQYGQANPLYDESLAEDLEWARKPKTGYDPQGMAYHSRPALTGTRPGVQPSTGSVDWTSYVGGVDARSPVTPAKPAVTANMPKTKPGLAASAIHELDSLPPWATPGIFSSKVARPYKAGDVAAAIGSQAADVTILPGDARLGGLRPKEVIDAENMANDPKNRKARISSEIKAGRAREEEASNRMAKGFGLPDTSSKQDRGKVYTDYAAAMSRVRAAITSGDKNKRVIPSKEDLEAAFILAQNSKNPPVSMDAIAELYNRYYIRK